MIQILVISLIIIFSTSFMLYRAKNDTSKILSIVLSFVGILDFITMVVLILIFKEWFYYGKGWNNRYLIRIMKIFHKFTIFRWNINRLRNNCT